MTSSISPNGNLHNYPYKGMNLVDKVGKCMIVTGIIAAPFVQFLNTSNCILLILTPGMFTVYRAEADLKDKIIVTGAFLASVVGTAQLINPTS